MITPYGAVFDKPEIPSPFESYDYFQNKKRQDQALKLQQRELQLKQKEEADKNFTAAIKPLNDFRANTGFTSITPDNIVTGRLKDAQAKAAEMYKQGRPQMEVNQFISEQMQIINNLHAHLKNAKSAIDTQLGQLPKNELDLNQIRQLAETELLQSNGEEDPNGIVTKVLHKYATALQPINREGLFLFKPDNEVNNFSKKLKFADGSMGSGDVSAKYVSAFQELKQAPSGEYKVVTRSEPAMVNGQPATDQDGKPIMILPFESFKTLYSSPGRMVEIEKGTQLRISEMKEKQIAQAAEEASRFLDQRYGADLYKMPFSQRQRLKQQETQRVLRQADPINEELVRQQVAWEIADQNIPKQQVQLNRRRDPDKAPAGSGGSGRTGGTEGPYYDAYSDVINESERSGNRRVSLSNIGGTASSVVMDYVRDAYGEKPPQKGIFGAKPTPYSEDDVELVVNDDKTLTVLVNGQPKKKLTEYDLNAKANPTAQYARKPIIKEAQPGTGNKKKVYKGIGANGKPIYEYE